MDQIHHSLSNILLELEQKHFFNVYNPSLIFHLNLYPLVVFFRFVDIKCNSSHNLICHLVNHHSWFYSSAHFITNKDKFLPISVLLEGKKNESECCGSCGKSERLRRVNRKPAQMGSLFNTTRRVSQLTLAGINMITMLSRSSWHCQSRNESPTLLIVNDIGKNKVADLHTVIRMATSPL